MTVTAIKAFEDNYIWAYEVDGSVFLIDPGQADPALDYLRTSDQPLAGILLTHEHYDHVDGVPGLLEAYPNTEVIGPAETKAFATTIIQAEDTFERLGKTFQVIPVPGHTKGHIAYLVDGKLFCGDALFMAGCGRVFTGDYSAQYETLKRLKALPDASEVYAGHEYTRTNLNFALSVEPNNAKLKEVLKDVEAKLAQGKPSLPSTIGLEKEINLFLQANTVEAFKALRDQRDNF